MEHLFTLLDNREIALLTWGTIFFVALMWNAKVRKSIVQVLTASTAGILGTIMLLVLAYSLLVILGLQKVSFWDVDLIKESLLWLFVVPFPVLMKAHDQKEPHLYLKTVLLDSLKLTVLVEFISNFYVFGLVTELIMWPIIILLTMVYVVAQTQSEKDDKYILLLKVLKSAASIAGIVVGIFLLYKLITNWNMLFTVFNLKELLLPIVLTAAFIPLAYLIILYSTYQSIFIRLPYQLRKNKSLVRYAKLRILLYSGLKMDRLLQVNEKFTGFGLNIKSKKELIEHLNVACSYRRRI